MNTIHLAVSLMRYKNFDPMDLCLFIEQWATSNSGRIQLSLEERQFRDCNTYRLEESAPELLFLKVDYDTYPTTGNYLIEIKQFVKAAAGHFEGIECLGIHAA